jgi:galactokinase
MAPPKPDGDRIEKVTAALVEAWGPADVSISTRIVRAPGSVTLMGGHTELNEGYVLPAAVEQDTWIAFRPRRDGLVRVVSRDAGQAGDPGSFWIDELEPDLSRSGASGLGAPGTGPGGGSWSDYVAGAAWSLREASLPVRGFEGVVDTRLPIGIGMASSAALGVVSALALLGGGHVLSGPALAAIAQRGERDYVGVDSGIVDQMASAAGREGRAMLLDCRSLEVRHVPLPYGIRVVICDTGTRAETRSPEILTRRADCARAVALLSERLPGLCSLRDMDMASLRRHLALLPEAPALRAEHVISENARVLATATALETGDLDQLGRLFAESHASLRDLYEVSSPALDTMVEVAGGVPGVVASRMSGPGFGGCTVNLVLSDAVPALKAAVSGEYKRRTGLDGRVFPAELVDGAGPVSTG